MGWFRADCLGSRVAFTDRHAGRRASELLGFGDLPRVPIRQVHGATVTEPTEAAGVEADAVVLCSPGHVATILTADCAPLAVLGPGGLAAVHVGWRGLLGGVVEAALQALQRAEIDPGLAVLGPCIRPCCYEFGAGDLRRVEERYGPSVGATTTSGSLGLDLPAAVGAALVGVPLHDLGVCTACSPDYFSYRRDGTAERQALLATVL